MRVYVYEYTCSERGDRNAVTAGLHVEGRAILTALLDDFGRIPGIELIASEVLGQDDFCRLARSADLTMVVAPESDGILLSRCRWVHECGGRLLGSTLDAIRLTADKVALARFLRDSQIPTPETRIVPLQTSLSSEDFPLIWKPRDGAGSQATFLVTNAADFEQCAGRAAAEGWHGEAIVQPYVHGVPASVAFLLGTEELPVPLRPAIQHVSLDGRFHYLGGRIPLPTALANRAVELASRAVQCVAGLCGYVGVDLVLGADRSSDCVIEINPRLTTSYIGLRALAATNLAEAMLHVAAGEMPKLSWLPGEVEFESNGRVTKCG
jgi:tyramine---L-glutamate ligase